MPQPLSQEESTPTLALTGFYRFSRPLTSKKVLLYYAEVCFGWLSLQTKERVSLNTSKEDICNVKGEMVEILCSIPGRSSSNFRKIKILSKHLLPQGERVLARASLIAVKIQCRPDFPLGEPIHGRGSCPPTSLPTGFSEWGLSHISHTWKSSPHGFLPSHSFPP